MQPTFSVTTKLRWQSSTFTATPSPTPTTLKEIRAAVTQLRASGWASAAVTMSHATLIINAAIIEL